MDESILEHVQLQNAFHKNSKRLYTFVILLSIVMLLHSALPRYYKKKWAHPYSKIKNVKEL